MQQIDLKTLFDLDESTYNQNIVQSVLENIKERSQAGFDYLKFKFSVENLQKMGMDEATSIKSAFTTASAMGMTKEELIKSIAFYEGTMQREKEEFTNILRAQITKMIDEPTAGLTKLDQLKIDNQRKIDELQREIDAVDAKKEAINAEVKASEAKIVKAREEFLLVSSKLDDTLNTDKGLYEQML